MKAIVVSSFPEAFMRDRVLPKLCERVEVLEVMPAIKAPDRLENAISKNAPDVVLHMTEFGSHSQSEVLSKICRRLNVTLRALSRKEASWSFLPPKSSLTIDALPPIGDLVGEVEVKLDADPAETVLGAIGNDLRIAREYAKLSQEALGNSVGRKQSGMSAYEKGKIQCPSNTARLILAAVGLPEDWRGVVSKLEGMEKPKMKNGGKILVSNMAEQLQAKGVSSLVLNGAKKAYDAGFREGQTLVKDLVKECVDPVAAKGPSLGANGGPVVDARFAPVATKDPLAEANEVLALYEQEIADLKKRAKLLEERLSGEVRLREEAEEKTRRFGQVEKLASAANVLFEAKLLTPEEFVEKIMAIVRGTT